MTVAAAMKITRDLCDVCNKRKAFYRRPYSGVASCKSCFIKSIEQKTRATTAKYDMFHFDDRIAVAVSGGKDSVSLLHVLAKIEKRFPKASLVAITVDEGIKGYRDEALKIAAENCQDLDVEHETVSFKKSFGHTFDDMVKLVGQKRDNNQTPCAYCGVLRRKALNMAARDIGADKVATGHTLDDETQTVLLNIFHGDVLRIAKEKPYTDKVHAKLIPRIKPFCEIPEKETALYAYAKRIRFQSTPCPYASDALRNDARVILDRLEEKHPGMKFTIFRSAERIRPALEALAHGEGLGECVECGEPTTDRVCRTCQMLKQMK